MLSSMKTDQSEVVDDIIEYMKEQARNELVLAADSVGMGESGSAGSQSQYDASKASARGAENKMKGGSRDQQPSVKIHDTSPSPDY